LRKEIGVTYQPKDLPIQLSAGYSLNIGFTGNLGWSIPLQSNAITVHQAITAD
jgi:D-serine dehydratase